MYMHLKSFNNKVLDQKRLVLHSYDVHSLSLDSSSYMQDLEHSV